MEMLGADIAATIRNLKFSGGQESSGAVIFKQRDAPRLEVATGKRTTAMLDVDRMVNPFLHGTISSKIDLYNTYIN
jgi:hypothetical protein